MRVSVTSGVKATADIKSGAKLKPSEPITALACTITRSPIAQRSPMRAPAWNRPCAPIVTSAPIVTCGMIDRPGADAAARAHHRIGADAHALAQLGVGRDDGGRMNARIARRAAVEQRGQLGQRHAPFVDGDDGAERTGWNRVIGRHHHRLRLAVRKRRGRIRADGEREVGRPFGSRGMHQAVDLDCAVAVEPARKRLCNVLDPHEI